MLREHDMVRTVREVKPGDEDWAIPAGTVGVVVGVYAKGLVATVEFTLASGDIAVEEVWARDLEVVPFPAGEQG